MRPFYSHDSHKQSHLLFWHSFHGRILSHHHYIWTIPLPSLCTASKPITFTHLLCPLHSQLCLMHIHSFVHHISVVCTTSQNQNSCPLPYPHIAHTMHCSMWHQFKFKRTPSPFLPHIIHLLTLLGSQIRGVKPQGVYWDLSLAPHHMMFIRHLKHFRWALILYSKITKMLVNRKGVFEFNNEVWYKRIRKKISRVMETI